MHSMPYTFRKNTNAKKNFLWTKKKKKTKQNKSKKIDTKTAFFFLLQVPNHHSITFNLRFLYELKHKVHLSKTLWDFPILILFRSIK